MELSVTHMVRDSAPPLGAEPTRRQEGLAQKVVNREILGLLVLMNLESGNHLEQSPMQVSADSHVWSRESVDDIVAFAAHLRRARFRMLATFGNQDVGLRTGRYGVVVRHGDGKDARQASIAREELGISSDEEAAPKAGLELEPTSSTVVG